MSDSVSVWQIALGSNPRECRDMETLLSPEEHERVRCYRHDGDRFSFIQRRAWLRRILASVTGIEAAQLELGVSPHGKPILLNGPLTLFFNMASSRNFVLYAVSRENPVGVDLEWMDPRLEFLPVASEHFSRSEYAMLCATPSHRQRSLFYRLWTAKEAYLKGIGCGLSIPLQEVEITWKGSVRGVGSIHCQSHAGEAWRVVRLPLVPKYFAILAMPNASAFSSIKITGAGVTGFCEESLTSQSKPRIVSKENIGIIPPSGTAHPWCEHGRGSRWRRLLRIAPV